MCLPGYEHSAASINSEVDWALLSAFFLILEIVKQVVL